MPGSNDDGTGALQPDSLLGVTVAGKYEVKRILGAGGMGAVYQARQKMLRRDVALKVLRPPADSGVEREQFDEMFLQEAAAAASLKSPHTVTVYDFGRTEKGTLYIAMDYLDGQSVQEFLENMGPLDVGAAVHVGIQVCRALREAHELEIVHRDLKPANVMLSDRNNDPFFATVLDFGLVGDLAPAEDEDAEGIRFLGSPKFAAPEQFRKGEEVDRRSDIYSFGLLMYAMLAGRPPFEGDTGALALAHISHIPPTLMEVVPGLPVQLGPLVHRCLAKAPAERFDNMTEVLRALGEVELPEESHEPRITSHDLADFAEELGLDSDELGAITDETVADDPGEDTDEAAASVDSDELGAITDEIIAEPSEPSVAPRPPPKREPSVDWPERKRGGRFTLLLVGLAGFAGVALVGAWIGVQFLPGYSRTSGESGETPAESPTDAEQAEPVSGLEGLVIEDEIAEEGTPAPAADQPPTTAPPEPRTAAPAAPEEPTAAEDVTETSTPYDDEEPPTAAAEAPPTEEVPQVDGYKDDPY